MRAAKWRGKGCMFVAIGFERWSCQSQHPPCVHVNRPVVSRPFLAVRTQKPILRLYGSSDK